MGIYLEQRSGKAIYLNTDEILMADYYPAKDDSPSWLIVFFKGDGTKAFSGDQADILMKAFKEGWEVDVIRDWEVGVIREGDGEFALCDPEELSQV